MRNTATHQVLAPTQPTGTTTQARVAAALARVEAGEAAGTAQTGQERVWEVSMTWPQIANAALRGVVIGLALLFTVQTLSGWLSGPQADAGVCHTYSNSWTVCVPATSPSGAELARMWVDGSAVYVDGYVFGGYSEV